MIPTTKPKQRYVLRLVIDHMRRHNPHLGLYIYTLDNVLSQMHNHHYNDRRPISSVPLTPQVVTQIQYDFATTDMTQQEIAEKNHVNQRAVNNAINGIRV